jgi:large subunit ribosomal protein L4
MAKKAVLFSIKGKEKEKVNLPQSVFSVEPNKNAIYDAIKMYRANRRQGTASTKERSEVRGGGRKPYRQKGTGRSRAGTIRSPLRRGGGVVFGPKLRDYSFKVPKKVKRLATRSALSLKNSDGNLKVIESFDLEEPKTKDFFEIIKALELQDKKVLFLMDKYVKNVFLSARNIPELKLYLAKDVNVYDILWSDIVVLTKECIKIIEEVFHG